MTTIRKVLVFVRFFLKNLIANYLRFQFEKKLNGIETSKSSESLLSSVDGLANTPGFEVSEFLDKRSTELEENYTRSAIEFQPWIAKTEYILSEQILIQRMLREKAGAKHFGSNCYIARSANILTSSFSIGDNSWIAAGVIVRGHVTIGSRCSINPYAHIAGSVKIGNGVRIAGLSSIYGFNHCFSRLDIPIYAQPHTTKGIIIGDNCWIGTNTVLVDGISLGSNCIVAGGAVVTSSFPDYSIIAGNPARLIRNRKEVKTTPQ